VGPRKGDEEEREMANEKRERQRGRERVLKKERDWGRKRKRE
jgi:hypothetical protein